MGRIYASLRAPSLIFPAPVPAWLESKPPGTRRNQRMPSPEGPSQADGAEVSSGHAPRMSRGRKCAPSGTPKTYHFLKETLGFPFLAHPWNFSVAEVLEGPPRTPRACPGEPEGVDMGPPRDLKNLFIP